MYFGLIDQTIATGARTRDANVTEVRELRYDVLTQTIVAYGTQTTRTKVESIHFVAYFALYLRTAICFFSQLHKSEDGIFEVEVGDDVVAPRNACACPSEDVNVFYHM